ncbi:MAG: efflux transporter outer membrane subunit [Pseudomonadota bacterium]
MKNSIIIVIGAVFLTACAVGPDYVRPDLPVDDWTTQNEVSEPNLTWWKQFDDPVLDQLIDKIAVDNLDVAIAEARIIESRALRGVARSSLLPGLRSQGQFSRSKQSENSPQFIDAPGLEIPRIQEAYEVGFDAGWELDVFGRNRRALEASEARLDAQIAFRRNAVLSVIAEAARVYMELRGSQQRAAILERNIDIQRQTLELVTASYEAGITREIDVTRAQTLLANSQAQLPNIRAEVRSSAFRLAVLAGEAPGEFLETLDAVQPLPTTDNALGLGLKSELLRRRPDIQIAERQLAASSADIGVAVAELFPRFNLLASVGLISSGLSSLFESSSESFSLAPSVGLPVFEVGRLRASIAAARARNEQATASYMNSVLFAFEEVERALTRYRAELETIEQLEQAVVSSRRSAELSLTLYETGLSAFIDVLDAERVLTSTEDALIQSQTRALTELVSVYKALGGGWEVFEPEAIRQAPEEQALIGSIPAPSKQTGANLREEKLADRMGRGSGVASN